MFSVTLTSLAPLAAMVAVIVTSSLRLRASRSTLWTMTNVVGSSAR
ncbi:MAG: hypothetical protein M3P93_03240 [Actinomycetota bacterium]|nr:hypothetical protein [Actinomycetota bacterium]